MKNRTTSSGTAGKVLHKKKAPPTSKEIDMVNREIEMRSIAESAPVMIIKTGVDTIIQYINGNQKNLIGKKIVELFHPDSYKEVKQKIDLALKTDKPVSFEAKGLSRHPKNIWYNGSVKRVEYTDKSSALVFMVQDNTAAKEIDQMISNAIAEAEVKERTRIAGDLHDGVCQHLATIHLSIDTLQKMIKEQDPEADQFMTEIKELTAETLGIARKVSHDLMPIDLLNSGFLKGVKAVVSRLNRVNKIKYTLNVWGREKKMQPNVSNNLYRIVQEFIHNSEKHSGACQVNIMIKYMSRSVELTIADNGKGFDPDKVKKTSGIGLQNMFNRIKSFTSNYEFKAKEGKGVSLYINIPI